MKLLIFIYSLNKKIEEIIEGKESIMYLKNKIFFLVMCSMLVLYTQLFNKMSREKSRVCIQWFYFNFACIFPSTSNSAVF